MRQSWHGLVGCEVAESDGEKAFRGGAVDAHQLLVAQFDGPQNLCRRRSHLCPPSAPVAGAAVVLFDA